MDRGHLEPRHRLRSRFRRLRPLLRHDVGKAVEGHGIRRSIRTTVTRARRDRASASPSIRRHSTSRAAGASRGSCSSTRCPTCSTRACPLASSATCSTSAATRRSTPIRCSPSAACGCAGSATSLDWPSNLWMGVSVENADALPRVDHLRDVPAAVRFLSCEPLIGPLDGLNLDGIHWVIAGGESGANHRPVDGEWVRGIRDACQDAGVAFFFKQWGGRTPKAEGGNSTAGCGTKCLMLLHRVGDIPHWPIGGSRGSRFATMLIACRRPRPHRTGQALPSSAAARPSPQPQPLKRYTVSREHVRHDLLAGVVRRREDHRVDRVATGVGELERDGRRTRGLEPSPHEVTSSPGTGPCR